MGQDMPVDTLHDKNCSLSKGRDEGNSVFAVWQYGAQSSSLGNGYFPKLDIFLAEVQLQHDFIKKHLETQVVFNFRQIGAAKIIILNKGKL